MGKGSVIPLHKNTRHLEAARDIGLSLLLMGSLLSLLIGWTSSFLLLIHNNSSLLLGVACCFVITASRGTDRCGMVKALPSDCKTRRQQQVMMKR